MSNNFCEEFRFSDFDLFVLLSGRGLVLLLISSYKLKWSEKTPNEGTVFKP